MQNLTFAGHVLTVAASAGKVEVEHVSGSAPLKVTLRLASGAEKTANLAPGEIGGLTK